MKLSVKTNDGRLLPPTLNIFYTCKYCGHLNELVRLSGAGKAFIEIDAEEYDSTCHKCDDVEKLKFEIQN